MHPLIRRHTLFAAVAVVALACADGPSAPRVDASASAAVSCPASIDDLIDQAHVLFGPDASNVNSVRGKLQNLAQHLRKDRTDLAKARAHDIVDFTLAQRDAGRLAGTPEQIAAFVNGVYCIAGIDIVIDSPEDTWFILPSDAPQILYGLDSTVGVSLPGLPVSEPSLLRIERFDGQLNTKLDQYPGFVRITLLNDGGTLLTGRATITVCAVDAPNPTVAERLRLGHGIRDTGFVITPEPTEADPVPANVLCDEAPVGLFARMMGAVRAAFTPRALQASSATSVRRFGGGVSGTVTEFSPFAPIDPVLSFGGGVSGTVTEFSREAMMAIESVEGAECQSVPVGTDLPAACQPTVSVRTFAGTAFEGVPVDWTVTADAMGQVAARSGDLDAISCGSYGAAAATATSVNGNAGVCWQLGGVGTNTVVARARPGGDAPEGVTFDNGGTDVVTFNINVTAVTASFVTGGGDAAYAGTPVSVTVRVVGTGGTPVAGAHLQFSTNGGSVDAPEATTDAAGEATITWTLGLGANTITAQPRNAPEAAISLSREGKTNPYEGKAAYIYRVSGDGQSGPSGEMLTEPFVVYVTDNLGRPAVGRPVFWKVISGDGTIRTPDTITDANGRASIFYMPKEGTSVVKAWVNEVSLQLVEFTTTGVGPNP